MKFLIINTDYPEFLRRLYALHPGLEKQAYEEQVRAMRVCLVETELFMRLRHG